MPALLKYIDLVNFKSYSGHHRIGPLNSFTAIVKDGSEQSYFMEAVRFVLGIHDDASVYEPVSTCAGDCSVTATFLLDDGSEKTFQRSVSDHKVDGKVVFICQYITELKELGIDVNATNLFIGSVESIAMQNSLQRTALFEQYSGSILLREDYDAWCAEVTQANKEVQSLYIDKESIAFNWKDANLKETKAENYTRLQEELQEKKVELQIFRIYHNEKFMRSSEMKLQNEVFELTNLVKYGQKAEENVEEKMENTGDVQAVLAIVEQNIMEVTAELSKKSPTLTEEERVAHTQMLDSAVETLEQARKAREKHQADIRNLEDQLSQFEKQKEAWKASMHDTGNSCADVPLEEAPIHYTMVPSFVEDLENYSDEPASEYDNYMDQSEYQVDDYLEMVAADPDEYLDMLESEAEAEPEVYCDMAESEVEAEPEEYIDTAESEVEAGLSSAQQCLGFRVDYSLLSKALTDLDEADEIRCKADELQNAINSLQKTVDEIKAPNMRAIQNLNELRDNLKTDEEAFVAAKERAQKAELAFEKVKKERRAKFMTFFEHVTNEVDAVYKALTMNQAAQALLVLENPEEPYLGGIKYDCVTPGKFFQLETSLSGEEKILAALALIFAIQSSPFIILDEVDAELDANIGKVANFIRSKKGTLQTIVFSLKEEFYKYADTLCSISSESVFLINLDSYDD